MGGPQKGLYIAKDQRSGMHSFVRVAPSAGMPDSPCNPSINSVNDLLMAKNVESLADAAEQLGPMFLRGNSLRLRTLDRDDFRALVSSPDDLLAECFFDPYAKRSDDDPWAFERSGNTARLAVSRAVENRDFCSKYPNVSSGEGRAPLIVEPLQDWVLLRNLLSVTLRVGALLREEARSSGTLLEDAGFSRVGRRTFSSKLVIDSPGYAIPVMFNPFFRPGSVTGNDLAYNADATCPLYGRIAEVRMGLFGASIGVLRGCNVIKFATGSQAEAARGSFKPRKNRPKEAKWMYLVIENREGVGQGELADVLLNALDSQLYRPHLSYSGKMMEEVSVCSYDLPTALWGLVRDHPSHYLSTCENCQRTVFSTNQGPSRRFCSDACRTTWKRRHGLLGSGTEEA